MKLSISNIAWSKEDDPQMLAFLQASGFSGLEIAPTRIFEHNPYNDLAQAQAFSESLYKQFGLAVSSMQSICFGIAASIFGLPEERAEILSYTKKAIDFAKATHCGNLVFGCPKNRIIGKGQTEIAVAFFSELGDYAKQNGTVLALEANPVIYGTNFINTTQESFDFVKEIGSDGLKVNFDFGTFLYNEEKLATIEHHLDLVNHIHISEPYLEAIQARNEHKALAEMLASNQYSRYVSIEMKNPGGLEKTISAIHYIKNIFHVA